MAEFKCIVSGLASSTDDRRLLDTFGRFGQILDCTIVPGILRSALLTFSDGQAMLDAIMAMNSKELDGKIITVDRTHFGKELKPEPVSWTGLEKQAAMEVVEGDPIPSYNSAIKERLELTGEIQMMMGEVRSSATLPVVERGKSTYFQPGSESVDVDTENSLTLESESVNDDAYKYVTIESVTLECSKKLMREEISYDYGYEFSETLMPKMSSDESSLLSDSDSLVAERGINLGGRGGGGGVYGTGAGGSI